MTNTAPTTPIQQYHPDRLAYSPRSPFRHRTHTISSKSAADDTSHRQRSSSSATTTTNTGSTRCSSINNRTQGTSHHGQEFETAKVVKQLVIRARPQPHRSDLADEQGLEVMMWLKIAIPSELLPPSGSPPLALPLMPDHNLRLRRSTVFPLTRRTPHSRAAIQSSKNPSESSRTASILNLSKSLRNSADRQPPQASVTIRNFAVCLIVSASGSGWPENGQGMAEYAVALDLLSLWNTTGPRWPFSVILPTPPCLWNSFRLILSDHTTQPLMGCDNPIPGTFHVNTFPNLHQERTHRFTPSRASCAFSKSSMASEDETRPLSDESEPECALDLSEEDIEESRPDWTQDEVSPRFEGVFPSTKDLCILITPKLSDSESIIDESLRAENATSHLSLCARHSLIDGLQTMCLDINLRLTLHQFSSCVTKSRTPVILTLPQTLTHDITSSQWYPFAGEGVIETSLPTSVSGDPQAATGSTAAISLGPPTPGPKLTQSVSLPELDLLHTVAPFTDSKWNDPTVSELEDMSIGEILPCQDASLASSLRHSPKNQFIAWLDTEWLVRQAGLKSQNTSLSLGFNGQLAIRPHGDLFRLPLFMLPRVSQQLCFCTLSEPEFNWRFSLPPYATQTDSSKDDHTYSFRLNILPHDFLEEFVNMHQLEPPCPPPSQAVQNLTPSTPPMSAKPDLLSKQNKPQLCLSPTSSVVDLPKESRPLSSPFVDLSASNMILSPPRLRGKLVLGGPKHRLPISPMGILRKRPLPEESPARSHRNKALESAPGSSKPIAGVSTLDVKIVIDPSLAVLDSHATTVVQYSELAIGLVRTRDTGEELTLKMMVPTDSDDELEIIGAWVGDRIISPSIKRSINEQTVREPARGVQIEVDLGGIAGDCLKMLIKCCRKSVGRMYCRIPTFGSPIMICKVSIQPCEGFQIKVEETDMDLLTGSTLIKYGQTQSEVLISVEAKKVARFPKMRVDYKMLLICWLMYLAWGLSKELKLITAQVDQLMMLNPSVNNQWKICQPIFENTTLENEGVAFPIADIKEVEDTQEDQLPDVFSTNTSPSTDQRPIGEAESSSRKTATRHSNHEDGISGPNPLGGILERVWNFVILRPISRLKRFWNEHHQEF